MNPILPAGAAPGSAPALQAPGGPPPNPSLRLDPILGVMVMEFRNGSDQVQRSAAG
jgi:hypothetical protein